MYNGELDSFDVQDWVDKYVNTKKASSCEIKVETCPECLDSKWKLYINVETKLWICQKCKWGTGLADIVILLSKISGVPERAVRKEILNRDIATPDYNKFFELVAAKYRLYDPPSTKVIEPTTECPGDFDFSGLVGTSVLRYAEFRGISREEVKLFRLKKAYKLKGQVGPWLIFPVYFSTTLVRWQARRITDVEPRFLSAPSIGDWLWPLSYGSGNFDFDEEVILVEGKFDALGAMKAQDKRVLCTYGKHITTNQIKVLLSLGIKKIYLAWDLDAKKEIDAAAERLKKYFDVYVVNLRYAGREGKTDPGDILRDSGLISWFRDKIDNAISVFSEDYYNYRVMAKLGIDRK